MCTVHTPTRNWSTGSKSLRMPTVHLDGWMRSNVTHWEENIERHVLPISSTSFHFVILFLPLPLNCVHSKKQSCTSTKKLLQLHVSHIDISLSLVPVDAIQRCEHTFVDDVRMYSSTMRTPKRSVLFDRSRQVDAIGHNNIHPAASPTSLHALWNPIRAPS